MLRRYLPLITLIIAVMIDISVVPMLSIEGLDGYMPLFSLMSVVALGLLLGKTRGILWGLVGGLLLDILVGSQMGLFSLICAGVGLIAGFSGRKYERYVVMTSVTALVCAAVYEIAMLIYLYLAGGQISAGIMKMIGVKLLASMALAQILYWLYRRMLGLNYPKF